ncbi:hypothetical protein GCM10010172_38900 [Paractinoplanes ferrugineus]|uniref:Uncharacterized protein n=1 Tax=Paractinoplanes ferrugineus TaxID=113564 RepID=A0A919J8T5_9ACTN|nr:hypothetical protein [Actinoplanes ferrugineus]GIE12666.1 hypothetical protein Afe05nite_45060 [Actinoplanes ferrugineus]
MHSIVEVGSRLEPYVNYPEGAALTMFAGEPAQLMIFISRPHALEIDAVTATPTRFAWVDGEHVGILVYRLGPILSWSQIAYTPHASAEEDGVPDVADDPIVRIVLVDRDDNTVKALNEVRWPAEFAATVRASVARMRDTPFSRIACDHVLAAMHRRYPTPEDLVVDRADAHCTATPVTGR